MKNKTPSKDLRKQIKAPESVPNIFSLVVKMLSGSMNCKSFVSLAFILFFTLHSLWNTEASLSGNYNLQRCYKLNITFHYSFPGGLTSSTIETNIKTFTDLSRFGSRLLGLLPECKGVNVSSKRIEYSPPGVKSVFFKIPIIFTASNSVADDQVDSTLTSCMDILNSTYKRLLDQNAPKISQGGASTRTYNVSSMSGRESCCGGSVPPPCCAAGAFKVSSTRCGCLPGLYFTSGISCNHCPVDTYQDEISETSCDNCPAGKKTFGKTGMSSKSNCSDANPIKLQIDAQRYLPFGIQAGSVVANVTVTTSVNLMQPFRYYIDGVTQRCPLCSRQRHQSRSILKRRRRDDDDYDDDDDDDDDNEDVCENAGSVEPQNYFCINRFSGSIRIANDFVFMDGEEYALSVRVTDSDDRGRTENIASVTFISRDMCNEIRRLYYQTVPACRNVSGVIRGEALHCPSITCLRPLYNWQMALTRSSEALRKSCSFDPQSMLALKQKYWSCLGPPRITLHPVSLRLTKGAATVLTCNASSPLPVHVTWYKNGKVSGFGNQLEINNFENEDQGDYYCKFSTDLTSSFSETALLVTEGVFTSIVSFTIANENYQGDLLDSSSSRYKDFQDIIQRNLEIYFNKVNPSGSYQVKMTKLRDSFGKVGLDLVVYSSAQNEDMTSYYNRLQMQLTDSREMEEFIKPFKVSRKIVVIKSATHCLPQETGKISIKGNMTWQITPIGPNSSSVKCPYGPPAASATRFCGGNFSAGGLWENPDASGCKYKSERTNRLDKLSKIRIRKQNVVKITKEVRVLTSQPDDMNEADAVLIAEVITDIVSLEDSLNETAQDVMTVVDNVLNMKKEDLKESQRSNSASTKFVQAVDKLATNLPLSTNESSRVLVTSSVAIQSRRADPDSFPGMTLAIKQPAADPENLTPNSMAIDEIPMDDVQTSITLPEVMFEGKDPIGKSVKIGFVVYQNDKFFQPVVPVNVESKREASSFMSRIMSSSVRDMTFDNLLKPVELVFEPAQKMDENGMKAVCVFWDFEAIGGLGNWSNRGCRLIKTEAGRAKCHCDHMTNFAVLFSASGPRTHKGAPGVALSVISYVGCAISLVGLFLTLITYSLFRNLRKTNQQPILMSLCVSLMLLLIVFIAGAGRTENLIGCRIVAVLLHYFSLSSVMWMGVEGYNMYMSFVQVMATYQSKFMLKASVVAWGLPALIVTITVSVATSYYGNDEVCVLYGFAFHASQFGPILAIIVVNLIVFILALRSLSKIGTLVSAEKKATSYQRARTSFAILLLLGLTWLFGALAISRAQIVFDYLFSIFNSLQGFLVFFFHCLRQQEVRNQWKMFLTGKGLLFSMTDSNSRIKYPLKTISKGRKYKGGIETRDPSYFKHESITCSVGNFSPSRPEISIVPAEV
ncbi:LOW QUALITY PROTEIN: adhesion G-protein coupled receptor G6-like [Montipora capricornis]|uniref:LOW QUALITY PROTEIN: adhesion G-protein coupled receptor G6-like n=1 Tax=Montipora capricornis TaxID=246305 RepID=UPI0035F108DD